MKFVFRLVWAGLGLAWICSLLLPVVRASSENYANEVFMGRDILLMGPLGAFDSQFGWFANLTFWALAGLGFFKPSATKPMLVLMIPHLLFVINAMFWTSWPGDEGGVTHYQIDTQLIGYYVWFFCTLAALGMSLASIAAGRNLSEEAEIR